MDEIAPEYDVVVLGTGMSCLIPPLPASFCQQTDPRITKLRTRRWQGSFMTLDTDHFQD